MISILIVFFTQYFQETHDLVVRISFFNQKVQGSIFFLIFYFYEQIGWKNNLWVTFSN
jgi:hypothetical protein